MIALRISRSRFYDPDLDGQRRNARGRRFEAAAERAESSDD